MNRYSLALAGHRYFEIHRKVSDAGLFVDEPATDPASGCESIAMSRRFNKWDGSFGGVIVAVVEPDYLRHFYESVNVGPNGTITLFSRLETPVLQVPSRRDAPPIDGLRFADRWVGIEEGSLRFTDTKGIDGLGAYRVIPGFPLVILVLLAEGGIFAEWRHRVLDNTLVAAGVILAVLVLRLEAVSEGV